MKILHYSLGFPPYRTGGLTKYCLDLMKEQHRVGNDVSLLWPGSMGIVDGRIRIRCKKAIAGILSYELVHPLPVALDEGVMEVSQFMKPCRAEVYLSFLKELKPDVIHFHTFMGIHKEFLKMAELLNIQTIYSAHDFYGLCPKVTLLRCGELCVNNRDGEGCVICNITALPLYKIRLMQSPLYRRLKNIAIVKKLRQNHRSDFFAEEKEPKKTYPVDIAQKKKEYQELQKYYFDMFGMIDKVHYNSTVTETVYKEHIVGIQGKVINITNSDIRDRKGEKRVPNKLRMSFLAAPNPIKGYGILRQALNNLWEAGYRNFELHSYGNDSKSEGYLFTHPRYQHNELEKIMSQTDLVVTPSYSYDTFGFVVLEALSFGCPVILSDRVGAKDIIEAGRSGIVVQANAESLQEQLQRIFDSHKNILGEMNEYIVKNQEIKTMDIHAQEIEELYKEQN